VVQTITALITLQRTGGPRQHRRLEGAGVPRRLSVGGTECAEKQAEDIALKQYKGKGYIKNIRLINENGKDVYVIIIHGKDGSVKVDATTGAIVKLMQQEVKDKH
jgi:hypothetical protein